MLIVELERLEKEPGRYDLTSLRTGIMAGSPCPVEVMKAVMDRMHMREVTIAYGFTEASPARRRRKRTMRSRGASPPWEGRCRARR
jgi:fatty-acyl-CoA synthase